MTAQAGQDNPWAQLCANNPFWMLKLEFYIIFMFQEIVFLSCFSPDPLKTWLMGHANTGNRLD